MENAGHWGNGAPRWQKLKLGAATANAGVVMCGGAGTSLGVINPTTASTTALDNAFGVSQDRGIYSSTQGDAEGFVTVNTNPNQFVRALISGSTTEGTALTVLNTTTASSGGTTMTDADVGTADLDGGIIWCIDGANVGLSRSITAWTSATSCVVTVPFPRAIATADSYLAVPFNTVGTGAGGADGNAWLTPTAVFTQADGTAAAAAGGKVSIIDLQLNGRSDSYVVFVLGDHVNNSAALVS